MLTSGGADVDVAGFHRRPWPPTPGVTPLGQTRDADLGQRMRAVAGRLLRPHTLARLLKGRDLILARNLEMLVLARFGRLFAGTRTPIVYECLDIHASLLGAGLRSRLLRRVEGVLLTGCDRLIVSSPAFTAEYFHRVHPGHPPAILLENRVLALDRPASRSRPQRPDGPPWRIGWFGMIRCKKSLTLLANLARALPGQIEVVIRGRPTAAVFDDFEEIVSALPGVRFEGPYSPADLPDHYAAVDFVWGMDFYEAGLNSSWLLPNRLYEGGAADLPILAQAGVETGRWLQAHGTGVVFDDPETGLVDFFRTLTGPDYDRLREVAARVPREALVCDENGCRALVDALRP